MLELLNIRFTFSLRTSHQNAEGKSPIVLRITFRKERRDLFTGLYCFEKDWDRNAGKVAKPDKNAASINENLALIAKGANNSFDELKFSRETFTMGELADKMKGKDERPSLSIDYFVEGNKKMLKRVRTEICKPVYNKYNRSLLYMQEFLEAEYQMKNFSLKKVSMDFIERYFQFLRVVKNIGHNTACKYLACIEAILSPAIRSGDITPDPFFGLKIRTKEVFREFLTQEEIDKIANVELDDPRLILRDDGRQ